MASIDLGRLVTESLNRFGGEEGGADLSDVFQEGAKWDNFKKNTLPEMKSRIGGMAAKYSGKTAAQNYGMKQHLGAKDGQVGKVGKAAGKAARFYGDHAGKIAGGAALVGAGALAYRYMKNKKKKAQKA